MLNGDTSTVIESLKIHNIKQPFFNVFLTLGCLYLPNIIKLRKLTHYQQLYVRKYEFQNTCFYPLGLYICCVILVQGNMSENYKTESE